MVQHPAAWALCKLLSTFFEQKNKPIPKWLIAVHAAAFFVVNLLVFARGYGYSCGIGRTCVRAIDLPEKRKKVPLLDTGEHSTVDHIRCHYSVLGAL